MYVCIYNFWRYFVSFKVFSAQLCGGHFFIIEHMYILKILVLWFEELTPQNATPSIDICILRYSWIHRTEVCRTQGGVIALENQEWS
jgi:hypothetical protein